MKIFIHHLKPAVKPSNNNNASGNMFCKATAPSHAHSLWTFAFLVKFVV